MTEEEKFERAMKALRTAIKTASDKYRELMKKQSKGKCKCGGLENTGKEFER